MYTMGVPAETSVDEDCERQIISKLEKKKKKGIKRSIPVENEKNDDTELTQKDKHKEKEMKSPKQKKRSFSPGNIDKNEKQTDDSPKKKKKKKSMELEVNESAETDPVGQEDDANKVSDKNVEKKKAANFSLSSFSAPVFRKKIYSNVGTELLVFSVLIDQKERDVVKEYFEAGGSASEILSGMAHLPKATPSAAIASLKILECLFLRTLRDFPLKQADSEQAAISLLKFATPFLNSVLLPTNITHDTAYKIKIVLKVLTAMVSLSSRVASEVLFAINLDKEVVQQLTKHPGTSKINSRVHFLHFLLAFLIDGNVHTIKLLLAKKDVLSTALFGLVNDPAPLVHLVLTTLRCKVLENADFSKSQKQRVFNTRVLENLVLLYEWQGPVPGAVKRNRKRRFSNPTVVDPEDMSLVREAVHSFLLLLLTSHKWGIIFASKSISSTTTMHNHHAFTVLRRLNKPWTNTLKGELLIKVLRACPNLLRVTLSLYKEALAPRPTNLWLEGLAYTIKVLNNMDFSDVLAELKEDKQLDAKELARLAEEISLPFSLLKDVLKPGLSHSHAAVREGCARLLTCVFENLSKHVQYVADHKLLTTTETNAMKQLISTQLTKVAPGISLVWNAWESAIKTPDSIDTNSVTKISSKTDKVGNKNENVKKKEKKNKKESSESSDTEESDDTEEADPQSNDKNKIKTVEVRKVIPLDLLAPEEAPVIVQDRLQEPDRSTQLSSLLSLLLGYQTWLPHWVEGSKHVGSGATLLKDIRAATEVIAAEKGQEVATKLQLQSICLLSSFDNLAISPSQELFPWALGLLVNEAKGDEMARKALKKLVARLDILQENPFELDLWILGLEQGGAVAVELMTGALVRVAKDPLSYTERQHEANVFAQSLEHTTSAEQQLNEMLDELKEEMDSIKNSSEEYTQEKFWSPKSDLSFSPLLLSALDEISNEKSKQATAARQQLVSCVLLRLLYHQVHPGPLAHVVLPSKKYLPADVAAYMKSWLSKKQSKLPKQFLSTEERAVEEYVSGKCDDKEWMVTTLNACLLRQIFHIATFHVAQAAASHTLTEQQATRSEEVMQFVLKNTGSEMSQECLSCVLGHPLLLRAFSLNAKTTSACLVTSLMLNLVAEASKSSDRFILAAIRQKTLHQVIRCFTKHYKKFKLLSWCESRQLMELMTHLLLDQHEVALVLDAVCQLPVSSWFDSNVDALNIPGHLATNMLNRLVELRKKAKYNKTPVALQTNLVMALVNKLMELAEMFKSMDLSPLENALYNYFNLYPHHLGEIPADLLITLAQRNQKSSLQLSKFLVSRNSELSSHLTSLISLASSYTLLSLVWSVHQSFLDKLDQNMLKLLWTDLQSEIVQAVKKPESTAEWLEPNIESVVWLLEQCLDSDTANKIVLHLQKRRISVVTEAHACMTEQVWLKSQSDGASQALWLLGSITHSLSNSSPSGVTSLLCKQLCNCLQSEDVLELEDVDDLLAFCKCTLRRGVGGDTELLEALSAVIASISPVSELDDVFEMLLSHSQFLPTLLGSKQEQKLVLLKVIAALTRKRPSLMNAKHVQLFLGTYNASLSAVDQLILKLLQQYEAHGVNFNELKPVVWGEAAVSRYALRTQTQARLALWNQPSTNQVLQIIEEKRVDITLARFPLDRGLSDAIGKVAPDPEVYDPAFLLPLLAQLLGPEMPVQAWRVTRQALGMCLMALASKVESTRIAAQLVIARLHFHLEAGRLTNENKSMLRFINLLRQSLYSAEGNETKLLPPLLGLFLAKATQVMSNPQHPLYMKLNQFLLVRQELELDTVPELLRLLHDLEPEYRAHQIWILEVLKYGLRTKADFVIFCKSFTFKLLACLYNSPLSDTEIKVKVLQVFMNVVQIPEAAWRLCSSNGLLSWLQGAATCLPGFATEDSPSEHFTELVCLIEKLWQATTLHTCDKNKESGFINQVAPSLISTLILLLPKIPTKDAILLPIIKTLHSVCKMCPEVRSFLSKCHLQQLLKIGHQIGVSDIAACDDLLVFGCTYAPKQCDGEHEITSIMRELIFLWKGAEKIK